MHAGNIHNRQIVITEMRKNFNGKHFKEERWQDHKSYTMQLVIQANVSSIKCFIQQ